MFLRQIPDFGLAQYAYLIGCQRTGEALLVDPERDVDRYLRLAAANGLRITAVADTHIHADYLSGARELLERHDVDAYLSQEGGPDWQFEWAKGHPNAHFLNDGDTFRVGNIQIQALLTPGHTPEHLSFLVTDLGGGADEPIALLTGDFIFVGDVGRPDLLESAAGQTGAMEPGARTLFQSLRHTSNLPGHLQILPAHGAGSACGKSLGAIPQSVLAYERKFNAPLRQALQGGETDFVQQILSGQPEPPLYFARMKRDNRRGPNLLPEGKLPSPPRLEPSQLNSWIGQTAILDLRENHRAFLDQHLKGALFAPLSEGRFSVTAGSYIPENTPILLAVNHPDEVDEAVRSLIRIGLDHIIGWILLSEALTATEHLHTISRISPTEIPADATILDVRRADEFAAGHLKSATHIAHTRLAARWAEIPTGRPLYLHCASGVRATQAASYVSSQGISVVHIDGAFADIPDRLKS